MRLVGGTPLTIQPGVALNISTDGNLTQGGVSLGRLDVVGFPEGALDKQGATLFRHSDPAKAAIPVPATEVHQGKLEGANVSAPESAARLVNLMRQFESLQRAITMGGEMNRKAIDELARVGS
ncbi:MAG: hypothetical protein H7Y20_10490 [Bryobacteraceae bacterium]|nr:hypothetical protein [Bryobacteraceae bacterium]